MRHNRWSLLGLEYRESYIPIEMSWLSILTLL
jgi:hypothetical protein